MKRTVKRSIIIVLLALMVGTFAKAQTEMNEQLFFVWEATVNPATNSQFIDLQIDFHSPFKENGFPYSISAWTDGNFHYYFFYPVESYNDKDGIYDALSAIIPIWGMENFMKMWETVLSHRTYFLRSQPEMSFYPEEPRLSDEEETYCIWDIFYVRPDKDYEMQALGKEFAALLKNKNYNDHVQIYSGDVGYEGSVYFGALFGSDREDLYSQNEKMWELLGEEGTEIFQKWMSLVYKRDFKQFWYLKELSYSPEISGHGN